MLESMVYSTWLGRPLIHHLTPAQSNLGHRRVPHTPSTPYDTPFTITRHRWSHLYANRLVRVVKVGKVLARIRQKVFIYIVFASMTTFISGKENDIKFTLSSCNHCFCIAYSHRAKTQLGKQNREKKESVLTMIKKSPKIG